MPENVPGIQSSTEWQILRNGRQSHIGGRTYKGNYKLILSFELARYLLTLLTILAKSTHFLMTVANFVSH